jgi:transcriptional regulator with XRE-family HTH domain
MPKRSYESPYGAKYPAGGLLRAARRRADLSQRDLARAAKIHPSTVGRIEAGELQPSLEIFRRLLGAAGLYFAVVDDDGRVVHPMCDREDLLDGAERRYPAHLDVIPDPTPGEWWGGKYGLSRPPETFHRDRRYRDERRKASQWEVRVAKYRHVPPPRLAYQG